MATEEDELLQITLRLGELAIEQARSNAESEALLERARALRANGHATQANRAPANDVKAELPRQLQPGDRVRITNRITRPVRFAASRTWTVEKERKAVIVEIVGNKAKIVTDNGFETSRLLKFLETE